MKKKRARDFCLLLLLIVLSHGAARAADTVVVVQSLVVAPYEEALRGFKTVCSDADVATVVVSEMNSTQVHRNISTIKPDLILAIGMGALAKVKTITQTPIVYLMVLNPQLMLADGENISGVSMNIPQERQLAVVREALPHLRRVGMVYDPEKTGALAEEAKKAAEAMGITLITKEVHNSKSVPEAARDLKGIIDLFWMLPDITVVSPEMVEFLLLFFLENKIPTLSFSEKYVEVGALMSISIDPYDIGIQAGEMAKEILARQSKPGVKRREARKPTITLNLKVAKKLGITFNEQTLTKAVIID
ncbi:MAG: ABC transporter substrate-binding protein [Deltaproteobacteria bacterium]|nr:ABC transporter substrate-binding protein [Deltaproteobacteria bacterium]